MSDYWMSTKSPVHMFKPEYETPEAAKYVTENAIVDPAILAAELRISAPQVKAMQRRLGVRKLTGNPVTGRRRGRKRGPLNAVARQNPNGIQRPCRATVTVDRLEAGKHAATATIQDGHHSERSTHATAIHDRTSR